MPPPCDAPSARHARRHAPAPLAPLAPVSPRPPLSARQAASSSRSSPRTTCAAACASSSSSSCSWSSELGRQSSAQRRAHTRQAGGGGGFTGGLGLWVDRIPGLAGLTACVLRRDERRQKSPPPTLSNAFELAARASSEVRGPIDRGAAAAGVGGLDRWVRGQPAPCCAPGARDECIGMLLASYGSWSCKLLERTRLHSHRLDGPPSREFADIFLAAFPFIFTPLLMARGPATRRFDI